ncbi:MAG TPA: protein-glutamate O-methyltransferase CheR [Firmicutes bacterium]|nr:protein-glutamate O-methyltransferase CheR [Bacillota bacterium]
MKSFGEIQKENSSGQPGYVGYTEARISQIEFDFFSRKILELIGVDLRSYKGALMERRLRALMSKANVDNLTSYAHLLQRDPARLEEFRNWFTINVSEFFRNPDKFAELSTSILPGLLKANPDIRVWSAGCANGSEPYSVAIILKELAPRGHHQVLATDIDPEALAAGVRGVYSERELGPGVSEERRRKFFEMTPDGFRVKNDIRRMVRFQEHDLLRDPYPAGFDLILCRNVVIYFTETARDEVFSKFRQSLKPGGVLFIGATESILNAREIGFEMISPFFYRRSG